MTKPVSQMVADMEERIRELEYFAEFHKMFVYRLVATHGNRIEFAKYSTEKCDAIAKMRYSFREGHVVFHESDSINAKNITPNNLENEL